MKLSRFPLSRQQSLGFEGLEQRCVLSAAPTGVIEIEWNGCAVDAVKDEWIVSFSPQADIGSLGYTGLGDNASITMLRTHTLSGLLRVPGASKDDIFAWAAATSGILYVEPNFIVRTTAASDDEVFDNEGSYDGLWAMNNQGQTQYQWNPSTSQFSGPTPGGYTPTDGADIDAFEAWDIETGSHDVVIGVLDTGIDFAHPDLYENIWINPGEIPAALKVNLVDVDSDGLITFIDLNSGPNASFVTDANSTGFIDATDLLSDPDWANGIDDDGNGYEDDISGWDFVNSTNTPIDDNYHGTHVAGTIGAVGDNGVGVAGVSWQVSLVPIKMTLANSGLATAASVASAIDYSTALRRDFGVNLVATNNSWATLADSQLIHDAISRAEAAEILFVAAAGNSDFNLEVDAEYPAAYPNGNIITVAGTRSNDSFFNGTSNYGVTKVDLGAPAVQILSTMPTYTTTKMAGLGYSTFYETDLGTSMAAPHVTGTVALLAARAPHASASEIKIAILDSVDPLTSLNGLVATGGRLNAANALAAIDAVPPRVTRVAISGPNALDGNHVPKDGVYDVPVGSGDQILSVPVGGAKSIAIEFAEDVDLTGTELTVHGAYTETDYTLTFVGYSNRVATWQLATGVFPADQLELTLDDSLVDEDGKHLDGDWLNPYSLTDEDTSVFPSGDGDEYGDFVFFVTILPGDFSAASGSANDIDQIDYSVLAANYSTTATGRSWLTADATGDGRTKQEDVSIVFSNWDIDSFSEWPAPSLMRMVESREGGPSSREKLRDLIFAAMADRDQEPRGLTKGRFARGIARCIA